MMMLGLIKVQLFSVRPGYQATNPSRFSVLLLYLFLHMHRSTCLTIYGL
uniref:Uncharacterized protein n=1 Tax=Rhizophora mucronata TaxID=61149 RepID=A0A2P2M698_RHIMU